MTALRADVRGGITNWDGALGNIDYGDCVIAGFEHLRMTHEVATASTFKKVLYKLGFRPPHAPYTVEVYTEYLATLGETPGPNAGVDPQGFLTWAKSKGMVKDFGSVITSDIYTAEQAMIDHDGLMLLVDASNLTAAEESSNAVWDASTPSSGADHCIALVKYDPKYWYAVTWGFIVRLTQNYVTNATFGAFWFDL
jgi:hypothetical protein